MPTSDIEFFAPNQATLNAKEQAQGVMMDTGTFTIPATTVNGSDIGLIRFGKGFSPTFLVVKTDDLDTSTNVTLDVGVFFDDTIGGTDDDNFFLSALDIPQDAGSRTWPTDDGLNVLGFVANGPGWITATINGGNTTTEGDVAVDMTFTYDK